MTPPPHVEPIRPLRVEEIDQPRHGNMLVTNLITLSL